MAFVLTEEQMMIQSMVREFARKVILPTAMERDTNRSFPSENLKKMGQLGLLGMTVPTKYNGEGADTVSYVLALSEIAYACASTAVIMSVHNSIVCESILKYGTAEQKSNFLNKLANGKIIGAFAMTEPESGSDPLSQSTTAITKDNAFILNGTKRFITTGKHCGLVIVTAKTDASAGHKGISAFIVEKDTTGLTVGREENKMGLRASDTCDLIFYNCKVPKANLLGGVGDGFKIAMTALDGGRIGIAAQSVGVAQAAFNAAVKYAKSRNQFGQKISKFQGLRWMIADMATQIEAARLLMLSAASYKDQGPKYTTQASMAKLFASEMVNQVTATALQIHGGYGVTRDYTVERLYRDARVFTIYEGTSEIQRIVISNNILKDKRR